MIIVAGSINMDYTVYVSHLPKRGETVLGSNVISTPGGKGANQAIASARMGGDVRFVGRVGSDENGRLLKENLRRNKVDARWVRETKSPTGVALITVDKTGENLITVAPGANSHVKPSDTPRFKKGDILLCQLEIPVRTVEMLLARARQQGAFTILDPAPAAKVALDNVDLLTPNEVEAEFLSGAKGVFKAGRKLLRRGARSVIIHLGARGSLCFSGDGIERFPAFKVRAVDTVGAGDAFVGALAAAIDGGGRMNRAIRFAQAVAALKVARRGAQNLPSRRQVLDLLE
jgi:ribokinase